ncbi:hypothetical protein Q8A67_021690 [Cirrhinus molitorella]|uniref:Uncharacterized protein n=1 Tax=Cirrhinus molitorella TaxID=172907 RepID=A0AA88PC05_9TELE|nr:hypothetical protein Q8A67_021690 [Cirrhinus molitorella]
MRVEWTGSAASVRAHAHQHTATLLRSASIGGCRCCCGKATRQILAKRAERVSAVADGSDEVAFCNLAEVSDTDPGYGFHAAYCSANPPSQRRLPRLDWHFLPPFQPGKSINATPALLEQPVTAVNDTTLVEAIQE